MLKYFILSFIFLLFVQNIIAQGPPPIPVDIPIDGGLSLLLIGGVVYAVKRLYKNNIK